MHDIFKKTIDDPNAPPRLKGLVVTAVLTSGRLEFQADFPDDVTANELAYFRLLWEVADTLRERTGIGMTENPIVRVEKPQ